MNIVLIMREEFVCLALLVYLLVYAYKFVSEERFFIRLTYFAIGHVVFDMVTIFTVNHIKEVDCDLPQCRCPPRSCRGSGCRSDPDTA